jgi:hypothetical protein
VSNRKFLVGKEVTTSLPDRVPELVPSDREPGRDWTHDGAPLPDLTPDLACVIDSWHDLPEPIRVAILAMIRSTTGEEEE